MLLRGQATVIPFRIASTTTPLTLLGQAPAQRVAA